MVQIKANLILFLLAGTALAIPTKPMPKSPNNHSPATAARPPAHNPPAQSPGRTLQCTVDGRKIRIPENAAKDIAKKAPSGKQFLDDKQTKKPEHSTFSSYPHQYHKLDEHIVWDNQACNSKKVDVLEFPIKDDNPNEMYPWKGISNGDKKPEKLKNLPCRVVYSAADGHYCGVMCHKSMKDENKKGFDKCT